MSIKTILVPFVGYDDEIAALKQALTLAKQHNAHLEVLHVTPDLLDGPLSFTTGFFFPSDYPERIVTDFLTEAQRKREYARSLFTKTADKMQVEITEPDEVLNCPSATFVAIEGKPEKVLSRRARVADLIVMCRTTGQNDRSYRPMVHAAIFRTGKPVLLMPPVLQDNALQEKVVIAWNGSFEAARAVNLAMPLLRGSKVCVFTGIEGETLPLSNKDLVVYLQRHGVAAESAMPELLNEDCETALKTVIANFKAGMLVMGAFSREDRVRETLLGSLTEEILDHAEIPVLMAN